MFFGSNIRHGEGEGGKDPTQYIHDWEGHWISRQRPLKEAVNNDSLPTDMSGFISPDTIDAAQRKYLHAVGVCATAHTFLVEYTMLLAASMTTS